jgi:hypothetical protein
MAAGRVQTESCKFAMLRDRPLELDRRKPYMPWASNEFLRLGHTVHTQYPPSSVSGLKYVKTLKPDGGSRLCGIRLFQTHIKMPQN